MYHKDFSRQDYFRVNRSTMASYSKSQALLLKFQQWYLMNVIIQLQRQCNHWYTRVKQKFSMLINRRVHLHRYWSIEKDDTQNTYGDRFSPASSSDQLQTARIATNQTGDSNFLSGLNRIVQATAKSANVSIPMQVILLPLIVPSQSNDNNMSSAAPTAVPGVNQASQLYESYPSRNSSPYGEMSTCNWSNFANNRSSSQIQFSPRIDRSCVPPSWSNLKANSNSIHHRNAIY